MAKSEIIMAIIVSTRLGFCPSLAVMSAWTSYRLASNAAATAEQDALQTARSLATFLNTDLIGLKATVEAMSLVPALRRKNLETFDGYAREVARELNIDNVLRDMRGQQLLNTRLSKGDKLPVSQMGMPAASEVGYTFVTSALVRSVAQSFLFLVVAPVAIDNQPTYVLNLSFPVERLQAMVRQTPLPPLVTVGVIGKDGQFLFRSKPPEDFVGRPAPPSLVAEMKTRREGSWRGESIDEPVHAAFSPVASSGWSVAAEIPATALYKPWRDALGEMIVALGILLAVAALFALLAGRRIPQPLNILIRDTRALGEDLQIDSSEPLGVKEFARLRDAQKVAAKKSTWRAKRNRL